MENFFHTTDLVQWPGWSLVGMVWAAAYLNQSVASKAASGHTNFGTSNDACRLETHFHMFGTEKVTKSEHGKCLAFQPSALVRKV